ncbi:MAG: PilZ domain-containing protein, partial [Gemmataceae bacterium]
PLLVKLVNISTTGIGIHRAEPFEVGTVLTIQVHSHDEKPLLRRKARVVHATEQVNGTWIVGTRLLKPLTEAEFQDVIEGALT